MNDTVKLFVMLPFALVFASVSVVVAERVAEQLLPEPTKATPADPATTGFTTVMDRLTGCEYLVTPQGGIAARLNYYGDPICKNLGDK